MLITIYKQLLLSAAVIIIFFLGALHFADGESSPNTSIVSMKVKRSSV